MRGEGAEEQRFSEIPDVRHIPERFAVRRLSDADIGEILALCRGNEVFYRYHPPLPTRESIAADMRALPPGKSPEDKLYAGFFEAGKLIAVMDLILRYPDADTAYIGFVMLDVGRQGRGEGSSIISEYLDCLRAEGFARVRLAADKENPQSNAFWAKNGFEPAGENEKYIIRESAL